MKYQTEQKKMRVDWNEIDEILGKTLKHPLGGKIRRVRNQKTVRNQSEKK